MKLIVGLGNPGSQYENTRHNAGFMVVDYLSRELGQFTQWHLEKKFKSELSVGELGGVSVMFLKPQTFMNSSGEAVAAVVNYYKLTSADVLVIHDDLDLKLGSLKLQQGVGPKVHNGLLNVEEKLGFKNFCRLRVGVDNRQDGQREAGEEYVLSQFTKEEIVTLNELLPEIQNKTAEWLQS
jgi:peptidyl-tRNA hydrolase, PTH1 family